MKSLLLSFFIFSFTLAYAGKAEKAFEALEVHNYFEAKRLFEKMKKSDPTISSYGLGLIASNDKNPFYQLDTALFYVSKAETSYPIEKEKSRIQMAELGVDLNAIRVLKVEIGEKAFDLAKDSFSVASFDHFIKGYAYSENLSRAVELRDSLAFEICLEEDTYGVYYQYMLQYPKSLQFKEAKSRYDRRLYEQSTQDGLLSSYEKFLRKYPRNPYSPQAMDSVYALFITENTVENYYAFVKNYPDNRNVSAAWRTLYQLYNKDYSKERIVEFRIDFPDYPFSDEVQVDYELSEIEYFPVRKDGLWGFINDSGHIMIRPDYDWVENFEDGLAMVGKDFKVGFVNKAGKVVIPLKYDEAEPFYKGYAIVSVNDQYGVINKANLPEIPLVYEEMNEFSQGLSAVMIGEKYGYMNLSGKMVIPASFDYAGDFDHGFAYVERNGLKGVINLRGEEPIPIEFDWLEYFINGRSRVRKDFKFGMYNDKGNLIVPVTYDHIGPLESNRCLAVRDEQYGYLDRNGKEVIPIDMEFNHEVIGWGNFENDVVKVRKRKLIGMVDTTGQKLLPAIFEDVKPHFDELVPVKKRGKWGYCDRDVRLKIQYHYEDVGPFIDGIAIVKLDGLYGVIDAEDNMLVPFYYQDIERLECGVFRVQKEGLIGIVDANHNVIVEPVYEQVNTQGCFKLQLIKGKDMDWFDLERHRVFWSSNPLRQ
jgi:hypothetical protein